MKQNKGFPTLSTKAELPKEKINVWKPLIYKQFERSIFRSLKKFPGIKTTVYIILYSVPILETPNY